MSDLEHVVRARAQLLDRGAMARHFYRLGRILLGRDHADALRDAPGWFDAPADIAGDDGDGGGTGDDGAQAGEDVAWDECIELLDPRWHALARALRAAGIPAPFDVDYDLTRQGRVGDTRAVMVWRTAAGVIGLVQEQAGGAPGQGFLAIDEQTDASAVITFLRAPEGLS